MLIFEIDEKKLEKISHYEIRKRKDCVVLVEVPKAHTLKQIDMPDGQKKA